MSLNNGKSNNDVTVNELLIAYTYCMLLSPQLSVSLTTEAIQNGQHKAEVSAAALGRTLGPVKTVNISNTETSTFDQGYYRSAKVLAANLSTSTPVEKGSLIVSQDADIVYYLQ